MIGALTSRRPISGHRTATVFPLAEMHGPMAYYAVLTVKGFLEEAELPTWSNALSRLGRHPARRRVPGVEISSGSGTACRRPGYGVGLRARGLGSRW